MRRHSLLYDVSAGQASILPCTSAFFQYVILRVIYAFQLPFHHQEMLDENDKKAEFLKEQLQCLREKNHRWKEVTIRQAIMWQAKSPCGYEMLRRSGCLTLPSRMTLKRYIGYCTGAVVSSLMKQRLHTESTHLSERVRYFDQNYLQYARE